MSWSLNIIGKPAAVAVKVRESLASNKCVEPEEAIRTAVCGAVVVALEAYPPAQVVQVEAFGSQSTPSGAADKAGQHVNSLSLKIVPLYGFVE